ncbi:MAG: YybH family protein [Thermoanaerobaculia bacterium]
MKLTKPMTSILALALLAAPGLCAQTIDRQAALEGVVQAEKDFAKTAAEKGIRDSFLAYLADDSVLFRPDPVNGKRFLSAQPGGPGFLSWYPVYSEVSLAGDLGFNTGPYELRPKGPEDKPVAMGNFSTVWRKEPDGTWKALIDVGVQGNLPPSPPKVEIALKGPAKVAEKDLPKVDVTAEQAAMMNADRAFAKAAQEKGELAAYAAALTDDARLLRTGRQPILGKAAVQSALAERPAPITWEPIGGGMSRSGDLGYTYGKAQRRESGPESPWVDSDNYMRLWRKQPDGAWKVAFEVFSPRPPKPPQQKKPPAQ